MGEDEDSFSPHFHALDWQQTGAGKGAVLCPCMIAVSQPPPKDDESRVFSACSGIGSDNGSKVDAVADMPLACRISSGLDKAGDDDASFVQDGDHAASSSNLSDNGFVDKAIALEAQARTSDNGSGDDAVDE